MIPIVIYARFSSHAQNEQSIEGQLNECYTYAERHGYTVVGEYIDRALSGTADNRPEFQRMIEDSSKKHFQFVLVYQLDRFARNRYDSATYKAKLKKNGVRVLSARENITDDASGVLIEGVLESMAEYYSAELSQKVRRGMALTAQKGFFTGGNIALGYYVDSEKRFQIDTATAPVILEIFEMYATGSTMADIIRHLNRQRIKTSQGNEFNKNSINRILTNKRYAGIYTYAGTEIEAGFPQIVPDNLFYEVQSMIEKKKKAPARAKAEIDYILTSKLFCGLCQCAMTGISGTGRNNKIYRYYQCVGNAKKQCGKKSVQKDYIEDLVINETMALLTPENIDKIAREVIALCEKEKNNEASKRLHKLLKDNEKATANLGEALKKGKATDFILGEIEKLEREHSELETQITLENVQHPVLTVQQVKFFMSKFKKGNAGDLKSRQAMIDTFVNKIYLYDDKMTILYNAQDSHSDVTLDDIVSSEVGLVDAGGLEPSASCV